MGSSTFFTPLLPSNHINTANKNGQNRQVVRAKKLGPLLHPLLSFLSGEESLDDIHGSHEAKISLRYPGYISSASLQGVYC